MGKGLNVLSLFDGMSCGMLALDRAGILVNKYYASEVDPYPIKVSKANYPGIEHLGDVLGWREWDIDWGSIDLLIGGSPCQGFSLVGKQLSFDDPRSKLFFEYVNILDHIKNLNPEVKFLLENVRMKDKDLNVITETLNVEPVYLNSNMFTPQSRPRWYWSNFIWKPVVYASDCEACVSCEEPFCECCGVHYYECSCIGPTEDNVLYNKDGSEGFRLPEERVTDYTSILDREDLELGLKPATVRKGTPRHINLTGGQFLCLTATYYKGIRADGRPALSTGKGVFDDMRDKGLCRMLTPVECERLQNVPDNYTNHVSKTRRYMMLGNGWTIDVISYLFSSLR